MGFSKTSHPTKVSETQPADTLYSTQRNDFPWRLKSVVFNDAEGDVWHSEMICEKVEQASFGKNAKVHLQVTSRCQVAKKNLEKMGLSVERIQIIANPNVTEFLDTRQVTIEIDLKKLEEYCKKVLENTKKTLLTAYTFNTKQQIVWSNVKKAPISKFSLAEH